MTEGSPTKLTLSFSLLLMAANLGQQLYMIMDTMIVGRGVGVEALASVGATDWSYWFALWVIQAMTQGFAVSTSQHFGEGNQSRIKRIVAMSIWLCLGIGIVLTVSGLVFARLLPRMLQTPDPIFQGALSYLMILYAGILVVMTYNMAAAILHSLGDRKTSLIAIVIAAITNILLDLLFVLVLRWGVVGAAFATVLAQLLVSIYCLLVMRKVDLLEMGRKDWKPESNMIKRQRDLGISLAFQHVLIAIGGMVLQFSINRHGFVSIAGFTVTNKVYGLLESSAISLGYVVATYTAQSYGAGQYDCIRNGLKGSVLIAAAMSVYVPAAIIAGRRAVLGLFIDSTSSSTVGVPEISYHYLFIMSCLLSSSYLLYTFRDTLQGLGNTVTPFLSGVIEFFVGVSAAVYFSRLQGTETIFFAEPCAWATTTLVLVTVRVRQVGRLREV